MAVRKYSQLNPKWSHETLGNTNYSIGRWGCNITSMSIGHSRLYPDSPITPYEMAKALLFTSGGLAVHQQDYPGFEFTQRHWSWSRLDKLKSWIRSKDRFAVIAVNNNSHFVFAYYWGILGLWVIDPIDGKLKLLKRHYNACGYTLFTKT